MRRNRLDLMTSSESAIQNAIWEVEKVGADEMLTEVVILLGKAKDLLSDFIDANESDKDSDVAPSITPTEQSTGLTTDPNDPRLGKGIDTEKVNQHEVYLVLSDEERAKGFVRPFRNSYVHVGKKIELYGGTLVPLSEEEKNRYKEENYVAYIKYQDNPDSSGVGIYVREEDMKSVGKHAGGCGVLTKMNHVISETYARNPKFYGATYCMGCMKHLDVNEFVWDGTQEKVGS